MSGNFVFANSFRKMVREPFGKPPCIHENQSRAMLLDEFNQAVVYLVPHFVGRDRAQFAGGNLDCEIELALVADVDDDWSGTRISGQKMSDFFDRLLGGGKPNAN